MIIHRTKKRDLNRPGEIEARAVVISEAVRAEVIVEGKHVLRECQAGDRVLVPIWSGLDLVARGKAMWG